MNKPATDLLVIEPRERAFATPEICCVFPFWSQSDAMNFDSNYNYLARVLPYLCKLLPTWIFVLLWPMKSRGADSWHFTDDHRLTSLERVVFFPWPYDTAMRTSVLGFYPESFKQLENDFAPTIYWMHQVESAQQISSGYYQSFNRSSAPAVIAQHHYIIHESLPYPMKQLLPRLWAQMGGTIASDRVILNSQHTYTMMIESFSKYLLPEQMQTIIDKSTVLLFGLVNTALFDHAITPHDKPVIVYNHRFEAYKRADVTAAVLNGLRDARYDFEIWVTQTIDQKKGFFPTDKIVGSPSFDTYIDNIAIPAINTINSVHETFCIAILDSLALGHIVVLPNSVTFPELVPPDYPFLFNTPAEQRRMLETILSTWPKYYDMYSTQLREYVRERFNTVSYVKSYANILQNAARDAWSAAVVKESTETNLDALLTNIPPGVYDLEQIAKLIRSRCNLAPQAMPNRRVVRELCSRGALLVPQRTKIGIKWQQRRS